jgi:hypothetical protein
MARPSIIDKLDRELRTPITSEMQVVYILVQLRKMLEYDGKKDTYPVLNFYGNWVVHTKLSASPVADEIVRLFDESMYRKINDTIDISLENAVVKVCDETLLREELRTFLESLRLPKTICTDSLNWFHFRKKLASVIEDTPLELRPSKKPTHFIKCMVVKNKSTDDALKVEWEVVFHSHPLAQVEDDGKMKLKAVRPKV